jgi:hypothetical protein
VVDDLQQTMSRRSFLRIGGLAVATLGALLVGCRPTANDSTASQSSGQTEAGASLPAPTAASPRPTSQAPVAAPTAVPQQAAGVACLAGVVGDPYPGHCRRYTDRNGDRICDLSVLGSGTVTPRIRLG